MKKEKTLAQWLIQKTNSESYRAGTLTGWKHPKVDKELISDVGGMQQLLQQARVLEQDVLIGKAGKIRFDWYDMGNDIRKIEFDVVIVPVLCEREGIEDPRQTQCKIISYVGEWKAKVKECDWIQAYYDGILERLSAGKLVSGIEDEKLFLCLNAVVSQREFIWENVFSANILSNSKVFKKYYKDRIITILKNYSPDYIDGMSKDDLLSMHHIHSYNQTLEYKGPLKYIIDETWETDGANNRYGGVINAQTIEHARPSGLSGCKRIITIENKANYEAMEYSEEALYLYCHGYFAPKEVKFIKGILDLADQECEFYHWGDMDYGGISIFQFIKYKVFPKLLPCKMDVTDFDEAIRAGKGIELKASTREKLKHKDAGLLSKLKARILETNKVIEQEQLL